MLFRSHILIAMGSQVKDDLVAARIAPAEKFQVFFPGLANPQNVDIAKARSQIQLPEDALICTFIGRLTQVKRPDRFLEVVKFVNKANPKIEFLVVGEGELTDKMKSEVSKLKLPVRFLGWRKDISLILNASDLLILTSDNEAVALTLIEASQAGIPIEIGRAHV